MTCDRRSYGSRSAHTLWEILVVLTILGAVAALVAPAIGFVRSAGDDVAQTTNDLSSLLQQARLMALERETVIDVRLDPAAGHAWIFALDSGGLRPIATTTLRRVSAADVIAAEIRPRYVFTPTGGSTGSTLVVRGIGGERRITVDPWAGGIHVSAR